MGKVLTRMTYVWFVIAATLAAASVVLLFRGAAGVSKVPYLITVIGYVVAALALVAIYRSIMVAAREQDRHAGPAPRVAARPAGPRRTTPPGGGSTVTGPRQPRDPRSDR